MANTKRDLEIAAHNQMFRAQKAELRTADLCHALNLLLNGSFEKFHTALTRDGAVHEFLLGTVRNVPVASQFGWPVPKGQTENRRIILWKTTFEQGGVYGSAYHEPDFRRFPNELDADAIELKQMVEEVIGKIPAEAPFLVEPKSDLARGKRTPYGALRRYGRSSADGAFTEEGIHVRIQA